jgi:prepilin-type processing-associated H-X9-DG protein
MQFTLSTLFLIIFNMAATLALFGSFGMIIVFYIFLNTLLLHLSKTISRGVAYILVLNFFVLVLLLLPAISPATQAAQRAACVNNLKQINLALLSYHDAYKHFPPINICDKNGKPLMSWRVAILPFMEYNALYDSLKKDESWNSPTNAALVGKVKLPELICPSAYYDVNNCSTDYVAVIGPGTAWHSDGPVKLSNLPDGGSHTVMLIEAANSDVHWAEPRDLTLEEALERMKTGKGLRISTAHPSVINVLFADGHVSALRSKMPFSLWKKILAGEIKDPDALDWDDSAPDMVDVSINPMPHEPGRWAIILGVIVWLISVALLFTRAIKSRPKPDEITQHTQINADE